LTLFFASFVVLAILGWLAKYFWIVAIVGIAAGVIWYRSKNQTARREQKQSQQQTRESAEKIVLRVAARNQGFVTPMEVVLESNLSLEEAGDILENLHKKGYASLRVADNGTYVYELNGLLTPQQKRDSERL
jgi:predicted transcriptional regulator